jgi:hypothetical protein
MGFWGWLEEKRNRDTEYTEIAEMIKAMKKLQPRRSRRNINEVGTQMDTYYQDFNS